MGREYSAQFDEQLASLGQDEMQSFSVAAKFQEWAKNVITIPDIRVLTTSRKILHPFSDVEIEGVALFFESLRWSHLRNII